MESRVQGGVLSSLRVCVLAFGSLTHGIKRSVKKFGPTGPEVANSKVTKLRVRVASFSETHSKPFNTFNIESSG